MTGDRRKILVLAPHPDDEIVGAAIAVKRALADGDSVSVLFLTTGIPAERWPWESLKTYDKRVALRKSEALQAAGRLGCAVEGFLEIPSRGLLERLAGVRAVVSKIQASELWAPAFEGGHQDHDAANALGYSLRDPFQVKEFAEYNFHQGRINANTFIDDAAHTPLSAEERAFKQELLAIYASEKGNLDYVACVREAIRPLAAKDYSKPAHEGTLFRERFQWVPFRHPRIDWTDQADVNRRLAAFIAGCSIS